MTKNIIKTNSMEQNLLSEKALSLRPKERLCLLLKTEEYPIVRKKTSAKRQIEEMIDFYNLCCFMVAKCFPNEQVTNSFLLLNFLISEEDSNALVTNKLAGAFKWLNCYENLENKISAIQTLFLKYESDFPDIYQLYNLDDFVNEKISDVIQNLREPSDYDSSYAKKLMERWELY